MTTLFIWFYCGLIPEPDLFQELDIRAICVGRTPLDPRCSLSIYMRGEFRVEDQLGSASAASLSLALTYITPCNQKTVIVLRQC
jgi:hypothetical protein